jgi:phenylalanyl-tRNA synthetase beta chain
LKILVSWLRELVDVPVPPAKLAADLHMAGFEVASVEPPPGEAGIERDAVIDFEITANRPDCLSVSGMAREVATLYDTPLGSPAMATLGPGDPARVGDLQVVIDDPARCGRYCGALAEVRVAPSPAWMQQRLAAAGIRAINNIVDITNYVLVELGHPMHAFDFERLGGRTIRVRTAREGETVQTLDGQDRTLAGDMLVIADAERPQAVGGVMGGADSEVSARTSVIALESAWFEPLGIRRTSRRLGLSTEASYRFERGADIDAPPRALARACALIAETGAGHVREGWIDAYPAPRAPRRLSFDTGRIAHVLGAAVPEAQVLRIFSGLGFVPERSNGGMQLTVPSWRVDVSRDVDLVEEVARHHGYDRLPTTFPALTHAPAPADRGLERDRFVRRLAASAGFAESVTFSFIERPAAASVADEGDFVEILNPLSEQFVVLRPSLVPGLVDAAARNRRRGVEDVRLYELGTVFTRARGERRTLGLVWVGAGTPAHWSGSGRQADFFDMKGAVELLAAGLGTSVQLSPVTRPYLVRGRTAEIRDDGGALLGIIGQLVPALAAARDVPAQTDVYVAELDLAAFPLPSGVVTSVPPPRHPAIVRDVSIVVDDTLPAAIVRGTIRASAPATLVRIREFDRYQGPGVPEGRVSLSYRLTFQASDRTLTDAEVQRAMEGVLQALVREHGAVQR